MVKPSDTRCIVDLEIMCAFGTVAFCQLAAILSYHVR